MPEMNGSTRSSPFDGVPGRKVVVLTTYEGDVHIFALLRPGRRATCSRTRSTRNCFKLSDWRPCRKEESSSPEASFQFAQHVHDQALTPAEVVVLRLIAAGNANKQIADELGITEDTVKGRVKSILSKLDANDRTHAAIIGLRRGIIELWPRPRSQPPAEAQRCRSKERREPSEAPHANGASRRSGERENRVRESKGRSPSDETRPERVTAAPTGASRRTAMTNNRVRGRILRRLY